MFYSYNFPGRTNWPQDYHHYNEGFNQLELDAISNGVEKLEFQDATTIGNNGNKIQDKTNKSIRSSRIKWVPQTQEWEWLYKKLGEMAIEANNKFWGFHLNHLEECIQYTEYYASDQGHYDWHQDIGPGNPSKRKVSITVQLSHPDEYEGGDLEMWSGGQNITKVYRGAGSVFIFPSYMMHRVTPVTKGIRKSFVLWVGGSHFV